ncbi:MAG: long-chain fatty acid--CoA ligase [Candidatus Caldatribacteriota bacterium]|nr:long-chain fatty acid--CoA ligase [Candidatus Caldatribacteriota bacterium]
MKLQTLNEMLRNSVNLHGNRTAFKVKKDGKFTPITYQEFYKKVEIFGTGLLSIGIKKFDHVGLVSDNRFEWIITDMAIIGLRAADVPCSGASSPHDIHFKLRHSDSTAAILEGETQFSNFYKIAKDLPEIKNIILYDKVKVFSEKEDTPEWAIPINFEENEEINKKFKSEIELLIKSKNKHIFLSSKAKKFLEKYLEENMENLLKETRSKDTADSVKNSLINRAMVIDGQYNKTQSHKIYSFEKINKIGEDLLAQGDVSFSEIAKSGQPDDLATIIYTSGTTSDPKGVMLTNSNFMHNAINAPIAITINKDDNFLSVLPSWHVYERTVEYCALGVGASTAYSKPFKQVLLPDLVNEKPSVMVSVPRIWESVYKGIVDNVKKGSSLQKTIFNWAINLGEEYKEAEGILNGTWPLFDRAEYTPEELAKARRTVKRLGWKYRLADKIVFKKIRKLTGGRFRFAISGGGALNESMDKFFNAIGLIITEGYGLTETSPILAGRTKKDNIMFTVGPPIPEVEIKIVDKDNHNKELPNGEMGIVLVKGPMVMKGYYKNEEKTKEVIKDGWFNTEDLGKKTYNGKYFKLMGRIKDTIVLRGGENVEPLPLEDRLKESEYINMAIIVGQDKPRLGALIVPDFETLKSYADKEGIKYKNNNELINNSKIISLYQGEQKSLISKEHGFMPYETVMGIGLLPHEFTVEAGEMTETLKMKRFEIHKKYKEEIDRICG